MPHSRPLLKRAVERILFSSRWLLAPFSRKLTDVEKRALCPYIPRIDLDNAILHDGHVPWYLPRRFVGIVRGNHVYFRAGAYVEGTSEGIALLGHELTHVFQYRTGMTAASYLWSTIRGYLNSRYEKAAFAVQAQIRRDRAAAATSHPVRR